MEENKRSNKANWAIGGTLGGIIVIMILLWQFSPMTVKNIQFEDLRVMVAETQRQQIRGLSNRDLDDFKAKADAMYFSYPIKKERTFWMKDMRFAIDIAWIADGKIVKVERNIQPPGDDGDVKYMYSRPFEVNGVLEVPAGGADEYGFYPGVVIDDFAK